MIIIIKNNVMFSGISATKLYMYIYVQQVTFIFTAALELIKGPVA
jgi:hypothetical protein